MRWLLFFLAAMMALPAAAHNPSDSFLHLEVRDRQVQGAWEIALRDLEVSTGLDANFDGRITWGELKAQEPALQALVTQQLHLRTPTSACTTAFDQLRVSEHNDGHYAALQFTATCPEKIETLHLEDQYLYDRDAQHKNLVAITNGTVSQSYVLSAESRQLVIALRQADLWGQLKTYIHTGIWHIWGGADHVLFLVALLLPCPFIRRARRWKRQAFGPAGRDVVVIITFFTIAHSITLALTAFHLIALPARLVEGLIAATIAFTAINNIYPMVHKRLWMLTFGFGLIHGIGFAGTLAALGLPKGAELLSLLSFNIGVEIAQILVVFVLLPNLFTISRKDFYIPVFLKGGSWIVFGMSLVWLAERGLQFNILKGF